ncbi:MAG: LysM peptidoglycan-binding domain-containing protein [Bacillota bacterium]
MLYFVRSGDTLYLIAGRFGTTIDAILGANVICNPDIIYPGEVLIIPEPGLDLPKAGGGPYYVVRPGDTLWCLAREFGTTIEVLARINQIPDPNYILAGSELLIAPEIPDPAQLKETWERTAAQYCDMLNPLQIHGIYYIGSFQWEALGRRAIPYLLQLLRNPCDVVRAYTVISFGRLGLNRQVRTALGGVSGDPAVADLVPLALRRIDLVAQGRKRVHLIMRDVTLLDWPQIGSTGTPLPAGTEVIALRWHIPSPTGEEGPRGGIQLYDYVQAVSTGRTGFLARVGFDEILLI